MPSADRKKLGDALDDVIAASANRRVTTVGGVVKALRAQNAELYELLRDELAVERLEQMARVRLRRVAVDSDDQMKLEGFESIPRRLGFRDRYINLAKRFEGNQKRLITEDKQLQEIQKLQALLQKYAKKEPKITVAEAIKRDSEG